MDSEKELEVKDTNRAMPDTFGNRYQMAKVLAQSGLMPNGMNTPEKVCVALQYGYELGLSPMVAINNIAVVNGKPSLGTDVMHAIVRHSKEYGGVEWIKLDNKEAECIVHRISSSYKEDVRGYYSLEMAKAAGLDNKDNWKKYPQRMLKHRALNYALRDAFPDILAGIWEEDEIEEVTTVRNITPPEEHNNQEKIETTNKAKNNFATEKVKLTEEEIF